MYEYAPALPKKKERLIAILSLLLGLLMFGFSQIGGIPFPVIYQLVGIAFLAVFIIFISRYLMRRYVYTVESRGEGLPPDFIVTEYYGRRITVVCRISVSDIEEVIPITRENRQELRAKQTGRLFYDYTADLFSKNRYLITVTDGEHRFCARILADDGLLGWLDRR